MNSLFPISSPSVIYRELAACAPILEKFGMALSPAETAALALQVRPAAHQTRGKMLETSKLDLQPTFLTLGATAEDFENQFGAVENGKLGDVGDISLLCSRKRRIENDAVGSGSLGKHLDFFDLAAAQIGCRIGLVAPGLNQPHGFEIVGAHELGEFLARIEMPFASDRYRHKKSAGRFSFPRTVKLKFCQLS